MTPDEHRLGATHLGGDRTCFLVHAPRARTVEVHLLGPCERLAPLAPLERGYHGAIVDGVGPGDTYLLRLDGGRERPDPASRSQPAGVHGPSCVVGADLVWTDAAFVNRPLAAHVLYELHVGTFTPEGTFDAVVPRLEALADLGVTALSLMPVAQFPGGRNWGYDGVRPFAAQASYGGRDGLARLVDAAHREGLAVLLDFVCNHLGPEGNDLADFGPYFAEGHATPWGPAVNLDGPGSDEVRRFFIDCAVEWVRELHVDGLRVDAVHALVDRSARPFLGELVAALHAEGDRRGRAVHVIAESDLNDPRLLRPPAQGGAGFDAQWCDDFHHALHAVLTGERHGPYRDFGRLEQLAKAYREAFVYTGESSAARGRRHGAPARDLAPSRFVVFAQDHDQVGNRTLGDRLVAGVGPAGAMVAAAAVLLSPFVPMLFMGEEYGEAAPFLYFVSHGDPALLRAVRDGRRAEVGEAAPDPGDESTFTRCRLDHGARRRAPHAALLEAHRALLAWRRESPALAGGTGAAGEGLEATALESARALLVRRWARDDEAVLVLAFGGGAPLQAPVPPGRWRVAFDSASRRWSGPLPDLPPVVESAGALDVEASAPRALLLLRASPAPPGPGP